jgi:hypothetical protein
VSAPVPIFGRRWVAIAVCIGGIALEAARVAGIV